MYHLQYLHTVKCARSSARVCWRSLARIAGSNRAGAMVVCIEGCV